MFVSILLLLNQNRKFRCFDWTKKTEDQPEQFDREHILVFFQKILGFPVFFLNSLFRLFCFYTKKESSDVSIEPKQTEDQTKLCSIARQGAA